MLFAANMAAREQGQGEFDPDEEVPARAIATLINRCLLVAVIVLSLALAVVVGVLFKLQFDVAELDKDGSVKSARLTALNETFGFCEAENSKKAGWIDTLTATGLIKEEVYRDCLQELDSLHERERRSGETIVKLKAEHETARKAIENLNEENYQLKERLTQMKMQQEKEQRKRSKLLLIYRISE